MTIPLALAILGEAQAAALRADPRRFEAGPAAPMRAMGFHEVRDLGPDELNATFFSNRADGLRVGSAGHILTARR